MNLIKGIIYIAIVLLSIIIFIFNFKGLRHFKDLYASGKIIALVLGILSSVFAISFSIFAFKTFTYQSPRSDQMTAELKKSMAYDKQQANYTQNITDQDYYNASESKLYSYYTKKGQADIDSYSNNSDKTKTLLLRNVGKKLKSQILYTTSGKQINLNDGKDRVLIFADDSQYSINQLSLFMSYNQDSTYSKINYVVIFPVTNGTDIQTLFANNSSIGNKDNINVVDSDSMQEGKENNGLILKELAIQQFKIQNLPSYISIDKRGIISNAGVGTIFTNKSELQTYLSRSFGNNVRLYTEINN